MPNRNRPSAITEQVKGYYEKNPYPNQRVGNRSDLLREEHRKVMKRILRTAGLSAKDLRGMRVLDCGCGTGEKAAYCSLMGADAVGFDISQKSIDIAEENAKRLSLSVKYFVSDFKDVNAYLEKKGEEEFDLVLCIGTLHHTDDPFGNFARMAKLVRKDGGKVVVGLYSAYGRLGCRVERKFLRLGMGEKKPDEIIKKLGIAKETDSEVKYASLADRYASPHETYHSLEEVLGWFAEEGITPVASSPKTNLNSHIHMKLSQVGWLLKNKGFFFVGGEKLSRKRESR